MLPTCDHDPSNPSRRSIGCKQCNRERRRLQALHAEHRSRECEGGKLLEAGSRPLNVELYREVIARGGRLFEGTSC